jgi:hypothetical protein
MESGLEPFGQFDCLAVSAEEHNEKAARVFFKNIEPLSAPRHIV